MSEQDRYYKPGDVMPAKGTRVRIKAAYSPIGPAGTLGTVRRGAGGCVEVEWDTPVDLGRDAHGKRQKAYSYYADKWQYENELEEIGEAEPTS